MIGRLATNDRSLAADDSGDRITSQVYGQTVLIYLQERLIKKLSLVTVKTSYIHHQCSIRVNLYYQAPRSASLPTCVKARWSLALRIKAYAIMVYFVKSSRK